MALEILVTLLGTASSPLSMPSSLLSHVPMNFSLALPIQIPLERGFSIPSQQAISLLYLGLGPLSGLRSGRGDLEPFRL
jgi:hypothetical protein